MSQLKKNEKLHFVMICANNVNRSTEAHDHLHNAGLSVTSYGGGNKVRFPGPSRYDPRIFDFGTSYKVMYDQLAQENEILFRRNGVLSMLERDIITKEAPQRWQDVKTNEFANIDVIICFEDRIFDIVLEDIQLRYLYSIGGNNNMKKPIHVICFDVKDTPDHAKIGGRLTLELCQMIMEGKSTLDFASAIDRFEKEKDIRLLYALQYL